MSCGQRPLTWGRLRVAGLFKQMRIHPEGPGKPLQVEAGPIPDLFISKDQAWSTPCTSCLAAGPQGGRAASSLWVFLLLLIHSAGDSCIPHRLQRPNTIC